MPFPRNINPLSYPLAFGLHSVKMLAKFRILFLMVSPQTQCLFGHFQAGPDWTERIRFQNHQCWVDLFDYCILRKIWRNLDCPPRIQDRYVRKSICYRNVCNSYFLWSLKFHRGRKISSNHYLNISLIFLTVELMEFFLMKVRLIFFPQFGQNSLSQLKISPQEHTILVLTLLCGFNGLSQFSQNFKCFWFLWPQMQTILVSIFLRLFPHWMQKSEVTSFKVEQVHNIAMSPRLP